MFTGLIREIGRLVSISAGAGVTRIDLDAPACAPELDIGDSLAVNGICLTVTWLAGDRVSVEAAAETRRVTTLPTWRRQDRVHLEPALRAADRLGGHLVLGHVDGQGRMLKVRQEQGSWFMTFGLPVDLAQYLLPKGSVAVDGVSLTVDSGPFRDRFTVNVIPHTWQHTLLSELRSGQAVNLEMDVLIKAARGQGLPDPRRGSAPSASPAGRPPLTMTDLLARGFRRQRDRGK